MNGGGADRVFFGKDATGLNSSQCSQNRFFSGIGTGRLGSSAKILTSGEIAPVPEPGAIFATLALVGLIARREFSRGLPRSIMERRASRRRFNPTA